MKADFPQSSEPNNPWIDMWLHPKRTIRAQIDYNPYRVIIWLAIASGILSSIVGIGYLWLRYPEQENTRQAIFIIGLLLGGVLIGIINLYFGGWIYTVTGSWIGGKGNFTDVKCAVGWSNWPYIIANLLNLAAVLVVPNPWLQSLFGFFALIASVWGFVIFVNMVGEAHHFSVWKGLLAIIIAWILIFVAMMIIGLFVPLLTPLFQ